MDNMTKLKADLVHFWTTKGSASRGRRLSAPDLRCVPGVGCQYPGLSTPSEVEAKIHSTYARVSEMMMQESRHTSSSSSRPLPSRAQAGGAQAGQADQDEQITQLKLKFAVLAKQNHHKDLEIQSLETQVASLNSALQASKQSDKELVRSYMSELHEMQQQMEKLQRKSDERNCSPKLECQQKEIAMLKTELAQIKSERAARMEPQRFRQEIQELLWQARMSFIEMEEFKMNHICMEEKLVAQSALIKTRERQLEQMIEQVRILQKSLDKANSHASEASNQLQEKRRESRRLSLQLQDLQIRVQAADQSHLTPTGKANDGAVFSPRTALVQSKIISSLYQKPSRVSSPIYSAGPSSHYGHQPEISPDSPGFGRLNYYLRQNSSSLSEATTVSPNHSVPSPGRIDSGCSVSTPHRAPLCHTVEQGPSPKHQPGEFPGHDKDYVLNEMPRPHLQLV